MAALRNNMKRNGDMRLSSNSPKTSWRRPGRSFRPHVELLETRNLLSASPLAGTLPTLLEIEPNNTLDLAQHLGDLTGTGVQVLGTVSNDVTQATDVGWYSFTLA